MNIFVCKTCQERFNNAHKPFILPCGHNLCSKCISKRIYSEKCFFCPFDKSFVKFSHCKLNLTLLKKSLKTTNKENESPKNRARFLTPCPKVSKKTANFLEVPKDLSTQNNETIGSINTESIYSTSPHNKSRPTTPHFRYPEKIAKTQPKKRRSSKRPKRPKAIFPYEKLAIVTASLLGGVFLLSKLSESAKNSDLLSSLKKKSSFAVKNLVKLIKNE